MGLETADWWCSDADIEQAQHLAARLCRPGRRPSRATLRRLRPADGPAMTLDEIGRRLGVTREAIRKTERSAMRGLWAYAATRLGREPTTWDEIVGVFRDGPDPVGVREAAVRQR